MKTPLAFIGTGIMGAPMAGHLLEAGHPLVVHNRTRSKADLLIARGARWAESPQEAARGAEVIFVSVPDTPDVQKVVLGEGGLIGALHEGQVIVDHSTISPAATRRIEEQVRSKGAFFLDAPVSGGDVGAKNATLSIMVGGDAGAFEKVKPLLSLLGKTIVHCGESGTGQLTKLANQALVAGTLLAVAEAIAFAQKNGLDLQKSLALLGGGAGASWQLSNLGPKVAAGDFSPGFMIELMNKDLRLLAEAARECGVELPGSELAQRLFAEAQAAGLGRQGTQAIYQVLQKG